MPGSRVRTVCLTPGVPMTSAMTWALAGAPLAVRCPASLDEVVGQDHLLAPGRCAGWSRAAASVTLYGPRAAARQRWRRWDLQATGRRPEARGMSAGVKEVRRHRTREKR